MCPRCGQNAPLLYRGVNAYCTACGAPRFPLGGASLKHAGRTSKVGGSLTRGLGWTVLLGGWALALTLGLVFFAAFGAASVVHWLVGIPLALVATALGYGLLKSGRQMKDFGALTETATTNRAIFALAQNRGGVLTSGDVARALDMTPAAADDLLTKLAKEHPEYTDVDIDEEGRVLYRFPTLGAPARPRWRVDDERPRRVDGPLEEPLVGDPVESLDAAQRREQRRP